MSNYYFEYMKHIIWYVNCNWKIKNMYFLKKRKRIKAQRYVPQRNPSLSSAAHYVKRLSRQEIWSISDLRKAKRKINCTKTCYFFYISLKHCYLNIFEGNANNRFTLIIYPLGSAHKIEIFSLFIWKYLM